MDKSTKLFNRRKNRVRNSLAKSNKGRPRLSIYRSSKNIYAQVIDDVEGRTLASASTMEKEMREKIAYGGNKEAAAEIGKMIAERAVKAGVDKVVFDRGAYLYHGRVKALADAAREAGLTF